MFPTNSWAFDLEIVNAILGKNEERVPGIYYCGGWGDHEGMGCSVLVAAKLDGSEYRTYIGAAVSASELQCSFFLLPSFRQLVQEADMLIGYGSRQFDAKVLVAKGIYIPEKKHFDFLLEIKKALNNYAPKGFKMATLSERCGGPGKDESGAAAPYHWQQGRKQHVVDYCTGDVKMLIAIANYYMMNNYTVPDLNGKSVRLRTPAAIITEG